MTAACAARPVRRRLTVIGLAATLAPATFAGCGGTTHTSTTVTATVPVDRLEADLVALTRRRGLAATSVSCPSPIPVQPGLVSTCIAHYPGGGMGLFNVRQRDRQGNVHLGAAAMIAPEIEQTIRRGLRTGARLLIECPADVPIRVGRTFLCVARRGRTALRLRVRITDAEAGYRVSTA